MAAYFLHAINIPWYIWWRHPNGNPPKTDPRGTKEALVAKEEATGNQLPAERRLHLDRDSLKWVQFPKPNWAMKKTLVNEVI